MDNLITVVSLQGKAWAVAQDGSRRELQVGDTVAADEMVVTAAGAQIDLQFADNQVLTLVGEQDAPVDVAQLAKEAELSQPLTPINSAKEDTLSAITVGDTLESEGHRFVQLVRIHEIIESDGFTPLTVARIQEVLRPLGMSLPDRGFMPDEWREHRGGDERHETGPAARKPGLSIELQGAGPDGVYNEEEIGPDGTVPAEVTLDDRVREGDQLVIKDGKGNILLDRPVTAEDLRDGVTVEVPVEPGDRNVTVEATVTTRQGFTGTDRDDKLVDNDVPGVSVELQGAGPDGVYNEEEIGPDGTVPAEVTLDDKVEIGDVLKVTDKDGNVLLERPVTQEDLDNGVIVQVPVAPGDTEVPVTATITDPAGNSGTDTDNKPVDNIVPTVTVELQGAGPDGVYNEEEIGPDGTVPALVTPGPTVEVGDNLVVTDKDGNILLERPVTQDDLDNGVIVQVPVAPGDTEVPVTATITDSAGNSGTDTDTKPVDNTVPTVSVELQGAGPDGVYNEEEIGPDGTVPALVIPGPTVEVGDTLVVTDKDGNILWNRPVTQDDLDNGVTVQVPVSPGDTEVPVTATITDPAGNSGTDTDNKPVDNTAPTVTVELQDAGPDGVYNEAEIGQDGTVPALVTPGPTVEVGDTLVVTDKDGNILLERPVTQDDLDNGVIVQVPVAPGDTEVPVTATITDPAGNSGTDTDSKPVDNLPPDLSTALPDQSSEDSEQITLNVSPHFQDVVSGKNLTYSATDLPPGLSIDPDTGVISGTIDHSASQHDSDGDGQADGRYSVTLTVTDEAGNSTEVPFTWTVDNPPPVAENDTNTTLEDTPLHVDASEGVLANDHDPDGDDPLTVTEFTVQGQTYSAGDTAVIPDVGELTLNDDGSYSFVPEPNWNGDVPTVTYTVSDGEGGTDTAELNITVTPVLDITLTASPQVTEGDKITVTASVETPVAGEPLHVILNNGQTITIPVGATSASIEVDSRPDDAYEQGTTTETFEVVNAVGGNEHINDSSLGSSATTEIIDDSDVTTVSVTTTNVTEDDAEVTFVFQLSNPPQTGETVTLTVEVAGTEHTVTIDGAGRGELSVSTQNSDVYVDPDTLTATVTDISGGNFEATDLTGASATAQITDTIDTVTAYLSVDRTSTEEGTGSLVYTVELRDANGDPVTAQNDVTVTTSQGTVTIAAGDSSGILNVLVQDDDIYRDGETINNVITDISEANAGDPGSFEQLGYDNTPVSTTVDDTIDTVTVVLTVDRDTTTEGTGDLIYTVELRDADGNPVTANKDILVVTEQGNITIPANSSSATLNVPVQGDDVYLDGETVSNAITNVVESNGGAAGSLEDLTFDGTSVSTVINDTPDTVTAYLSVDRTSTEEGAGDLVYTVELRDANDDPVIAQNDVTVTTSQGIVTIVAGSSSGTLAVPVQGDDVYLDGETVDNVITDISEANAGQPGSFEDLGYDNTPVSTTVDDTIDTVTAYLSVDRTSTEEGTGDLVYTVELRDANGDPVTAQNDVTVSTTLGTVTIAAGDSSGTLPVPVQNDDVYLDGETVNNVITDISEANAGDPGSFEDLGYDNMPVSTTITDTIDPVTATLTSVGSGDEDAGSVTYTVTLDHAPQGDQDFSVTLSNGQTVTITVLDGELSGDITLGWGSSTPVGSTSLTGYPNSDIYKEADFNLTVDSFTATNTGNFEQLDLLDGSTDVIISDTIDPVTVVLTVDRDTAEEGETDLIYTVTLQDAAGNPIEANNDILVVTDQGNITIPAGSSSATLNVPVQGDDVYLDGETVSNAITNVVESNGGATGSLEDLTFDDTPVSTVINDTTDTVTAYLSVDRTSAEEGTGDLVYTVELRDANGNPVTAQNDVTVSTTLGPVTIVAGDSSGTLSHSVQNDDVYVDGETIINAITDISEANAGDLGSFEQLDYDNTPVSTTINDTIDTVTAYLNVDRTSTEEGTGSLVYTVELRDANGDPVTAQNDVTVSTTLGPVTIAAGDSSGTLPVPVQNDDVYLDGETVNNVITDISEANAGDPGSFEDLGYDSTPVSTTITDTIDPVTATLTSVGNGDEDAGAVTYTVTLDHAPQGDQDFSVTLSNGQTVTVTVLDGETSGDITLGWGSLAPVGSTLLDGYPDSDVYKEPDFILEVTDFSAVGNAGNYEQLNVDDQSTPITIADSITPVTITLSDVTGLEGESHTITATLDYPVTETDLVILLDNGATIIIEVGQSSGVSTPFTIQSDDVYVDGESYEVAIDRTSGGNFEQLVTTDKATVTVDDTIDTVTAYLSVDRTSTEEGAGDLVYTVELRDANDDPVIAQNDVTVTTSQGIVTIVVGSSSGTLAVPVQNDDVYLDGETVDNVITGINEANAGDPGSFEGLGYDNTPVSTTVTDTINPVYAQISVNHDAVLEGGELTYTVSLVDGSGNPVIVEPGASVTVQLAWSGAAATVDDLADFAGLPSSVTIGAGQSESTFTVITLVDAVKEYSEPLNVTITGVDDDTAGATKHFEELRVSTSKGSASSDILDAPTIGGSVTVYEKGLGDASDDSESAGGVIRITAPSGLDSIVVDGQSISLADLQALDASSPMIITIAGHGTLGHGTLTLTGFTPTETVNGEDAAWEISYTYTLTDEQTHTEQGIDDLLRAIDLEVVAGNPLGGTTSVDGTLDVTVIDDIPTVTLTGDSPSVLQVEESSLVTPSATVNFSGAFATDYGADGAATSDALVYSFTVNTAVLTGLFDTGTGAPISLHVNDDGDVEGRVGSSADVAFVITVDDSGNVTLTQGRPLSHPVDTNPNDILTLANGALSLQAEATDGDGDKTSASINIGDRFSFKDDGPSLTGTTPTVELDEAHLATGSDPDASKTTSDVIPLNIDSFGGDGAGDVQFTGATKAGLEAMGLTARGDDLVYTISPYGHTLIAYRGSEGTGNEVFTVVIDDPAGTPGYRFTLNGAFDHINEFDDIVSALRLPFNGVRVTDADGDSVTTEFSVIVKDDAPDELQPTFVTVNEDSLSGSDNTFNTNADAIGPDGAGDPGNTTIGTGSDGPQYGTATVNPDGTITYVPYANYSGKDAFTYTTETDNETKTFTVEVTVTPEADAPHLPHDTGPGHVSTANVSTNEDESVQLRLKTPVITDDLDRNGDFDTGDGSTEGDHPERLGAITLTVNPSGTPLATPELVYTLDVAGTEQTLTPNSAGGYTIIIVETSGTTTPDTDLHHSGSLPTDNVNYLTRAEYESIQAAPAEDRHENFEVVVKVSSYEVDDSGAPLDDSEVVSTNGAESTQTITVDVLAVTDKVALYLQEDASQSGIVLSADYKAADITLNEDTSFNLTAILNPDAFKDTDGSETRYLGFDGLPDGTIVTVGGTAYTIGSSGIPTQVVDGRTVPVIEMPGTQTALPVVSIQPPKDFSGDLTGIKVILAARDSDSDNPTHTPVVEWDEITLNLHVNPVGGDVDIIAPAETKEDTPISFLGNIKVSDDGTDGSVELIRTVKFQVPDGWTVAEVGGVISWAHAEHGTWTLTKQPQAGDWEITLDGDTVTIRATDTVDAANNPEDALNLQDILGDFEVTPPPHSSLDITLEVQVDTVDINTVGGSVVVSSPGSSSWEDMTIEVTPVAEVIVKPTDPGYDTDGNGTPDLTINPSYEYAKEGFEDQWFDLAQDTKGGVLFELKDGWNNEDANEETYARLTPELIPGDGQGEMNATGSIFRYSKNGITTEEGGDWVEQIYVGTPIDIPLQYLDTLQFKARENFAGKFKITVQAYTLDYDDDFPGDKSKADTKPSGEATLTNVLLKPVADQATVSLNARATGLEDNPIVLRVHPRSSDPSEIFTVKIDKIPAGAKLTYDGAELTLDGPAADGTYSVEIPGFDHAAPLTIQPPPDSNDTFTLEVQAKTVDTLVVDGETYSVEGDWSTPPLDIQVDVKGVADPAVVTPQDVTYVENELDEGSDQIQLSELVTISLAPGELAEWADDNTGSEILTVRVTGLPEGFILVGGGKLLGDATGEDREWLLTADELATVTIKTPANFSGTQTFEVRGITTENDGNSHTSDPITVTIKVQASVDAAINSSATLVEDTLTNLDFSLTYPTGDQDETLTGLWVKVGSGGGSDKFTLYLGDDAGSAVALADAGLSTENMGGESWYQLTPEQATQLWAKGNGNLDGDLGGFEFRYEVTDSHFGATDVGTELSSTRVEQGTYQITATAVTDPVVLTIKGISGNQSSTVITDSEITDDHAADTATLETLDQVTVTLNVAKQPDANAGSAPDHDGSEKIIRVLIDGVPQGVSVVGGEQTGEGSWLVVYEGSAAIEILDGGHDLSVSFEVGKYTANLTDHPISITVQTQDRGEDAAAGTAIESGTVIWKLTTEFTGEDPLTPEIADWYYNDTPASEDVTFTLDTKFVASVEPVAGETNGYTIALKDLPPGTKVEGINGVTVTRTEVDGKEIWTASTTGGNEALQDLLKGIQVTPPPNWNDNYADDPATSGGPFTVDATLSAYVVGGGSISETIKPAIPVIPVTDAANIILTVEGGPEGVPEGTESISLTVQVDLVDNPYGQIVDGKLYISAQGVDGELRDADGNLLAVEDGWYVLGGVQEGQEVKLTFVPSAPLEYDKAVTFEAKVDSTETGAANTETASTSQAVDVHLIHDGVTVTYGEFTGAEAPDSEKGNAIQLTDLAVALKDSDHSEAVETILLSGVPEGFLVYVGTSAADAGLASMANNAGIVNGTNTWELPVMSGGMPPYVAILPPKYWSGEVAGLGLTVESGETSLPDTLTETFGLPTLTVTPVANGLTMRVTNSFGTEGEKIPLNLNAAMADPVTIDAGTASNPLLDGSTETTTLVLTGLGEHAAFYAGPDGSALLNLTEGKVEYSADKGGTYTLTGLTQTDLDNLSLVQARDAIGTVTVQGQTVDGASESAWTDETPVPLSITAVRATTGDDTFLYDGGAINGGLGEDTIQLRYGESLTGDTLATTLSNIEKLDLGIEGANSITSLKIEDVFAMTDGDNILKIIGDNNDSVTLQEGEWSAGVDNGEFITYTGTHSNGASVTLEVHQSILID